MNYWGKFGRAIGEKTPLLAPPAKAGEAKTRSLRVRPATVLQVRSRHLDVVYERLVLPEEEKFDVIVGTNIFVYCAFEQTLAELNLAAMLHKGGLLLTNDGLPVNGGGSALNEIGFTTTAYSDRESDGDRIVWMERRRSAP